MEKEVRQEASVPVEGRVNVANLAELAAFWEDAGELRSMSQVIGWSLAMLCEIIRVNYPEKRKFESVTEAHKYLVDHKLYQRSKQNRSMKKIAMAMGFESLRTEGIDPKSYAPMQSNILHNEHSVRVYQKNNESASSKLMEDAWETVHRVRLEKQRQAHELHKQKEEAIKNARENGLLAEEQLIEPGRGIREGMSDEELDKYNEERERKVREREGAPLDLEWLRKNAVKE